MCLKHGRKLPVTPVLRGKAGNSCLSYYKHNEPNPCSAACTYSRLRMLQDFLCWNVAAHYVYNEYALKLMRQKILFTYCLRALFFCSNTGGGSARVKRDSRETGKNGD